MFYKRKAIKNKSQYNDIAERELSVNAAEVITRDIKAQPYNGKGGNHDKYCGFKGKCTEKRWCRCLVNFTADGKKKDCATCDLKDKFGKPIENATFTDFEIPVSSDGKVIGEVDVKILYEGQEYYTEVKPEWNTESLLRMIAEIITYCYVLGGDRKKAILFVENSEQYNQWNNKSYPYYASEVIRKIIKENDITVFCLHDAGATYRIEKMN